MSRDSSRKLPLLILGLFVLVAAGLLTRWWLWGRFHESTDNAYVRADVSYLAPRVGGEVVELRVQNHQPVKAGQLLLKIEDADYRARVAQARAQVAMHEAALLTNRQENSGGAAQVAEAEAALQAALAEEARLHLDMQRAEALVKDGVATRQRLDNAASVWKSAVAQSHRARSAVTAARARLGGVGTGRAQLLAELDAAKAALALAEMDLAATEVRAPINGVVGDLAARRGGRVAPGARLLAIVPLESVFIEANFKETQLTRMAVGQKVEVALDAFPDLPLTGVVQSLSPASGAEFALLPPDNATGNFNKIVQRVPVRIRLDRPNTDGRLRPGLSAEVTVATR